jgi:hypothetical protein
MPPTPATTTGVKAELPQEVTWKVAVKMTASVPAWTPPP